MTMERLRGSLDSGQGSIYILRSKLKKKHSSELHRIEWRGCSGHGGITEQRQARGTNSWRVRLLSDVAQIIGVSEAEA